MIPPKSSLRLCLLAVILPLFTATISSQEKRQAPTPSNSDGPTSVSRAKYRSRALATAGSAPRGRKLFEGSRARCSGCHAVEGKNLGFGPHLLGVADKYDRDGLITSILEPSSALLPGYRTTVAVLKSGDVKTGLLRERNPETILLIDSDGKTITLRTSTVKELRSSDVSVMPEGLHTTLSPDEFADLIAYLETLKQPSLEKLAIRGLPDKIVSLPTAIAVVPFTKPSLRFDQPVWFSPLPDTDSTFVILEHRRARIWLLEKRSDADRKLLFVDLKSDVSDGPWEGLMSIAFHPAFTSNRRYFLKHETIEEGQRKTLIVERRASEDGRKDSGTPSRRLLEVQQPADNHNGGTIVFGPDGYLFAAMGDGGPQKDPNGHAQNRGKLLGSLLRIDVDRRSGNLPYAIPPTNPWADGRNGFRPEVWATGFREPWRFTFDMLTGDLWLGDVGQNLFEEVTIVRAGENHGWNVYEGFIPFSEQYRNDGEIFTAPVVALMRKHGVSITGGYVYRGSTSSSFYGVYIFGDYESRKIWGLTQKERRVDQLRQIGTCPEKIASFGEDADGNLYIVGYGGTIYRLDLSSTTFE